MGSDDLYGDGGQDILLGDIGYCIRRYSGKSPLQNGDGTWHKDIVLEELGNIAKTTRISSKVDTQVMNAESIAAASLLFVANAYNNDGTKFKDSDTGEWVTDLFTFNLETAYDDYLDGGDGNDGKMLLTFCMFFNVT